MRFSLLLATIAYCFFAGKRARKKKTKWKIIRPESLLSSMQSKFSAFGFICFRFGYAVGSPDSYSTICVGIIHFWMNIEHCALIRKPIGCSALWAPGSLQWIASAREWKNYGSIHVKRFDPNRRRWMRSRWQCNARINAVRHIPFGALTRLGHTSARYSMKINQMNVKSFWHHIHMSSARVIFGGWEHPLWRGRRVAFGVALLGKEVIVISNSTVCFYHFDMI